MTTDNDSREVDLLRRDTLFQSYFRVDQYELRHSLFAGGMGDAVVREVFERGHMAAVLPVNPANDSVVMIEQFRPGAYAVGWHPWLLECVAGVIEPGETASGVAGRETMEEAGCEIRHLERIAHYLSSPGASTETVTVFVGRVDAATDGALHGLAEEGEDIRVHVLSIAQAVEMLDAGEFVNSKTIIAVNWLARHYPQLKQRWLAADA